MTTFAITVAGLALIILLLLVKEQYERIKSLERQVHYFREMWLTRRDASNEKSH